MPCFCTVPADVARNRMSFSTTLALPPVPLSMKLLATLPHLDPAERLDMKIDAGFDPMRLPNISILGGPLAQISLTLALAVGNFKIDLLPQLEFEMEQAASSFQRNIWPRLGFLTTFKIQPLLNLVLAARLALDLRELGLDPMTMKAGDLPPHPGYHNFAFRLSPFKLKMARLTAALPNLLKMNETLKVPPLGDNDCFPTLNNRLNGLAGLSPPSLQIPFPMILKLAMVLESLATIKEAFGDDALSPSRLSRIEMMMRLWMTFNIPIPMPALALKAKLEALPPMEDIRLGEEVAGSSGMALGGSFSPPKIAILPFLNVMIALHAALNLAIDLETWDQCATCNSA